MPGHPPLQSTTMTDTAPDPTPAPQKRLPFNEELRLTAEGFTQHVIDSLPEVEGVMVIVSYAVPNKDMPYAFVRGQTGGLRTPVEIVHMTEQLLRAWNYMMQNGYQCTTAVDAYMKEQAAKMQTLQGQIDAATERIRNLTSFEQNAAGSTGERADQPDHPAAG